MSHASARRGTLLYSSVALIAVATVWCLGLGPRPQADGSPTSYCVTLNGEAQIPIELPSEAAFVLRDVIISGAEHRGGNEHISLSVGDRVVLVMDMNDPPLHLACGITISPPKLTLKAHGEAGSLTVTLCGEIAP